MGFIIGKCHIWPPSAKAAVLLSMWFYGVPQQEAVFPGYWQQMAANVAAQYVAAGDSKPVAVKKVAEIEQCFGTWEPHKR